MEAALWTVTMTVAAAAIALAFVEVVHRVVRRLGDRSILLRELAQHAHRPFQVALLLLACQAAVRSAAGEFPGRAPVLHLLVLATIAGFAWLVAALLLVSEDVALARFRTDVPDNRRARKLHTQVVMLRRVTVAGIVVVTAGVMLMTFPHVRAVGASVLASAGVIGVVAALAAQSVLGNVFAGLQLTFSDAVRLDDVVVVEGEWGRIEELTLSYVVVQIWDDRRLILPTSHFTTKPFENWTRTRAAVLGTAEFDLDWSVPVAEMREELRRFVEGNELWDGRVCVLQVTEATGGMIQVRALVSAVDAPTLWDLRCLVREHLVEWVRERHPDALPRLRADVAAGGGPWTVPTSRPNGAAHDGAGPDDDARVFGGSDDGDSRAESFVGPSS